MSFERLERVFTNTPWEKRVGYCRALKAGDYIHVSGTAPVDESGKVFTPGNGYTQAKKCFEIIRDTLAKMGVPISKVVRTRMFVTDISRWEEYSKAHSEFFSDFPPVTSMVEVKGLMDPDMLIELEADAYVGET